MAQTLTYMLTNMITGDTYVGVTSCNGGLKHRLQNHKWRLNTGKYQHLPLYKNMSEYGFDNFRAQILCEGNDEEYYCWLMQPTLNQCWVGKKPISQVQVNAARKANSKGIRCVETGIEYPSARDAGRKLGNPKLFSGISNVLKGKAETAGGYHWEYVTK